MKYLALPVALAALVAFGGQAAAGCGADKHQTVEKPEKPQPNPSA